MKICCKCKNLKSLEHFCQNKNSKDGKDFNCKTCKREYSVNWRKNNPLKAYESVAKWKRLNRQKHYNYNEKYRKKNQDEYNYRSKQYTFLKNKAQPRWLNQEQKDLIMSFYKKAKELSTLDNVQYDVDHIIPIKSDIVCGLHVPWNLQILTHSNNCSKGNRLK